VVESAAPIPESNSRHRHPASGGRRVRSCPKLTDRLVSQNLDHAAGVVTTHTHVPMRIGHFTERTWQMDKPRQNKFLSATLLSAIERDSRISSMSPSHLEVSASGSTPCMSGIGHAASRHVRVVANEARILSAGVLPIRKWLPRIARTFLRLDCPLCAKTSLMHCKHPRLSAFGGKADMASALQNVRL
jgi:hypothetical protein